MEPLTSNFWLTEAALLYTVVFDIVDDAARAGVLNAASQLIQMLLGVQEIEVDYGLLNEAAHAYAADHTFALVSQITDTSRQVLQDEFTQWITSGDPLPALTDNLTPMFGPVRANMIATTEITRVYADSNIAAWSRLGVDGMRFQTVVDDIVCPICEPFHGEEYRLTDSEHTPPIHVNCRCYLQPIVNIPEVANG
ncbi:MAG TPA: minor capsid protein [Promineifilum sp.]